MIKLYKDIIARGFFAALSTLLSAYIVGGFNGLTIAAVAVGAATGTIIEGFVRNKL